MLRAATLATSVAAVQGAHWAVLVAGSNSYSNYRHQADVCHAYQVVKSKGIPEENIIVMAYDDIANNSRNPFPGQLFNKPTEAGVAGTDVYSGCNIDYKGADVTPENFAAVLKGTASGKKLQSTSDDNVFIFFSDHGAPGLIAFPNGQEMHKADLQSTFDTMHSQNMYKKLVMYLETCESGSMFEGLSTPNVYALSAASPSESSWGWYCSSSTGGASVNGKSIGSCLGDLFSIAWMEDSDLADITQETLDEQFSKVKTRTSKSAVMQWGELGFKTDTLDQYQGGASANSHGEQGPESQGWDARQIDLMQAYENYIQAAPGQDRVEMGKEFQAVLGDQLKVEAAYQNFLEILYPGDAKKQHTMKTASSPANQQDCEVAARQAFKENGDFDSNTGFAMQFHRFVVNVCADVAQSGANVDVTEAAKQACTKSVVV